MPETYKGNTTKKEIDIGQFISNESQLPVVSKTGLWIISGSIVVEAHHFKST